MIEGQLDPPALLGNRPTRRIQPSLFPTEWGGLCTPLPPPGSATTISSTPFPLPFSVRVCSFFDQWGVPDFGDCVWGTRTVRFVAYSPPLSTTGGTMKPSVSNHLEHRCLTLKQVAAVLSISPRRLRQLACDGKIPRIELGWRTHLYEPQAVLHALKQLADGSLQ
jgi:hypothetical protein